MAIEEFSDLPLHLADWTYETVVNLIKTRDFEDDTFDFKAVLNPTSENNEYKKNHRDSIRRTVCSMANTCGGFIIFGIKDQKNTTGGTNSLEDRICGVPLGGELLKDFGEKIAVLQPNVHFESIPQAISIPDNQGKGVFVVYIPQSQRRPHMVFFEGGGGGIYYRRGEHGAAEPMTHNEVRDQMMYTEDRIKKVTLLRLELMQYIEIANIAQAQMTWTLDRFDVSAFKVLLAEVCSLIPQNLLRKALDIPRQATKINKRLDDIYRQDLARVGGGIVTDIQRDFRVFIDLCDECEKALENDFGSLGIG
jgi:hypothetical protein